MAFVSLHGPLDVEAEQAKTSTRELLVMLAKYVLPPMSLILMLFLVFILGMFPDWTGIVLHRAAGDCIKARRAPRSAAGICT
ncbi:hypothetical protein M8009_06285 [Halomonas sp. ATCH28]|uniref:Uncharacterized protein n=1 Tax=Halomonas gemina TaxID=2945105 RepID=A0ABT0SZ96_9GAMM|nr:hypothetical protein [Halomonas gemina]MCL7939908.1 hypothetical protein [Halomonas gemina]